MRFYIEYAIYMHHKLMRAFEPAKLMRAFEPAIFLQEKIKFLDGFYRLSMGHKGRKHVRYHTYALFQMQNALRKSKQDKCMLPVRFFHLTNSNMNCSIVSKCEVRCS